MPEPLILKINLAKVGEVRRKDGRAWLCLDSCFHGKDGAEYLDAIAWPRRDGPDQYGNSHRIDRSLTKEQRDKKEKAVILGNARPLTKTKTHAPAATPENAAPPTDDSEIPF